VRQLCPDLPRKRFGCVVDDHAQLRGRLEDPCANERCPVSLGIRSMFLTVGARTSNLSRQGSLSASGATHLVWTVHAVLSIIFVDTCKRVQDEILYVVRRVQRPIMIVRPKVTKRPRRQDIAAPVSLLPAKASQGWVTSSR
jgi:hypothetical protein